MRHTTRIVTDMVNQNIHRDMLANKVTESSRSGEPNPKSSNETASGSPETPAAPKAFRFRK